MVKTGLHLAMDRRAVSAALLLVLVLSLAVSSGAAAAQEDRSVQVLTGRIEPGQVVLYRLPGLAAGQQLYVHTRTTSGNLDPFVALVDGEVDPDALESEYEAALDQAVGGAVDPLEAIDRIRDRFALAWDDDGGGGLTAALEVEIPADGDYRLLVAGALSALGGHTFGDFRLSVGLNAPEVLQGGALPGGDPIAMQDVEATPPRVGVQDYSGFLTPDKPTTFVALADLEPGDTLYAHVEATSGDLVPSIVLQNFARKPIRSGNLDGSDTKASLQYTLPSEARNYRLLIASCCGEEATTSGDYRLLVGINSPEVLTGRAETGGRVVIREPIEVGIGVTVEQIIELDQQSEFFTAACSLQMEWTDPALAFNPEDCQCDFRTFSGSNIDRFLSDIGGRWPEFSLQNQQGNRWVQNRVLVVFADGRAVYFERFTTNFQVDFDFRRFPFDVQTFVIRVDSLYPEEYYRFANLEKFSGISAEHGEDEFNLTGFDIGVASQKGSGGIVASRYTFSFEAPRHLTYYFFSIFVPILLIIAVSWITFFLRDYGRRIEVASANLLLFIAFSWSLADNYPRLGYLTFLDAVMAIMFVVNAMVVAYNVVLRRWEMQGRTEHAERVDTVMDWVYPLTYIASFGVMIWLFL